LVFARSEYAAPLRLQGRIEAADLVAASEAALERFGPHWVELTLVPEASIRWVLRATDGDDERAAPAGLG
jgi:hypothetical protein